MQSIAFAIVILQISRLAMYDAFEDDANNPNSSAKIMSKLFRIAFMICATINAIIWMFRQGITVLSVTISLIGVLL